MTTPARAVAGPATAKPKSEGGRLGIVHPWVLTEASCVLVRVYVNN